MDSKCSNETWYCKWSTITVYVKIIKTGLGGGSGFDTQGRHKISSDYSDLKEFCDYWNILHSTRISRKFILCRIVYSYSNPRDRKTN